MPMKQNSTGAVTAAAAEVSDVTPTPTPRASSSSSQDSSKQTQQQQQRTQKLQDPPSHFSIDNSLSNELLKLSFQDRVAVEEEIHGVRCLAPDETLDLLERSLLEFDGHLMALKRRYIIGGDSYGDGQARTNTSTNTETINDDGNEIYNAEYNHKNHNTEYNHKQLLRNIRSTSTPDNNNNHVGLFQQQEYQQQQQQQNYCYLNDPFVRLRFLRCECFNAFKAVQRMIHFLELTSELFGDYVADRPIRLSDFNTRQEEVALRNSRNQYLPFRDRSGRRVFVGVGSCDLDLDPDLRYKIITFLHWVTAAEDDIETQQKGVVIVAWPSNEDGENSKRSWEQSIRPKFNQRLRYLQRKEEKAKPLRVTSQQVYLKDTPFFRAMSTLYYIGMNSDHRLIFKAHYGEPTELRYVLASYGIPEHLLPISNTGTVKTANHSRWINAMRAKLDREQRNNNGNINNTMGQQRTTLPMNLDDEEPEEIVNCPGSRDVIFRKGPTYKNNPGNMYFRELIEATQEQHTKASRKEKCNIIWDIVEQIEAHNGRFLDWNQSKGLWMVARDREKIRNKVAASFKQFNRSILAIQEQQKQQQAIKSINKIKKEPTCNNVKINSSSPFQQQKQLEKYHSGKKRRKTSCFCNLEDVCYSSSSYSN